MPQMSDRVENLGKKKHRYHSTNFTKLHGSREVFTQGNVRAIIVPLGVCLWKFYKKTY